MFYAIFIVCQICFLFAARTNGVVQTETTHLPETELQTETEARESVAADNESTLKWPTVLIITLFRNKGHTAPYFLTYLDRLDYPKDRIALWFRSDHNEDNTLEVVYTWLYKWSNFYHGVNIEYEDEKTRRESEQSQTHWSDERYLDVIRLKEEGLNHARKAWADYVFFLDADVFLPRSSLLQDLINQQQPIIAPMLQSDGLYSNFWCGMTEEYYYQRTKDYKEIYGFKKRGVFQVPMVHSAVLINLNDKRSDSLTFNKTLLAERFNRSKEDIERIPTDDIIVFALSANYSQIPLTISNNEVFGYVTVPLDSEDDIQSEIDQMTNIKTTILSDFGVSAVQLDREMEHTVTYPESDTMTFDRIFMINLLRRSERRERMEQNFKEIGLTVERMNAIDGQELTPDYLEEIGVRILPGYADPYQNRPMTMGEIGCFLSHFWIWEKVVMQGLKEVLILEDDIIFESFFKDRALNLMNDARRIGGWDLIYFGRKRIVNQTEEYVNTSQLLTWPGYSYWTLGYALSLDGAKKLLEARPLEKLIPVDEFLPIMFNQHLNDTWRNAFTNRSLIAWSASPLLLFPSHYTGDDGYYSDTENSDLVELDDETNTNEKKGNRENFENIPKNQNEDVSDKIVSVDPLTSENDPVDAAFLLKSESVSQSNEHHSEL